MKGASNKQWVHPPEALLRGQVIYNVKYLGESEVDAPKGTEFVKESIRKRKFNKQIMKAEGVKTPRVDLVIAVDGVTIKDARTKVILHQYPLHRISYCADDKSDKKMMTFIAKSADSNLHFCYVFQSERNAEEITLTIGQAFDLAYRRFLDTTGKDHDLKKQFLLLQKKVQTLEKENQTLKKRIIELEQLKDRADIDQYKNTNQSTTANSGLRIQIQHTNGTAINGQNSSPLKPGLLSPPPPSTRSRTHGSNTVTQKSSPLVSVATDAMSQPAAASNPFSTAASSSSDPFGTASSDPFGMGSFMPAKEPPQDIDKAIQNMDKDFMDLQTGFSQGLSFGTDDFSLDDLDPLNQK